MTDEIEPGVVIVATSVADGRVGVIAGDRIALAVDAGINDAEGRSVLAAATTLSRPAIMLAYTHGHVDHALGGTAFVGHEILASPAIAEHMAVQLDDWAVRGQESRTSLEERLGWPTIMFEAGGELDLGGRRVQLIDTPGHAPGALCVLDPEAGILFGGDTVVTGIPPFFADGNSITLEATLRRLAKLDLRILVPGHGDIVRGRAAVRQAIEWEADYLARCREHVRARSGDADESIVATATYDDFIGERLPRDQHRMEWRHQQAIRLIIEEERQPAPTG